VIQTIAAGHKRQEEVFYTRVEGAGLGYILVRRALTMVIQVVFFTL
jgi:hypothetical protein